MNEIFTAPPTTNRGVQTAFESGLRACVDWVQVTFTTFYQVQQIYSVLGMEETQFIEHPYGKFGYRSQKKCGDISILYDGRAGMGIHVMMTGQGCRQYETYTSKTWKDFFLICFQNEGKFTRLDVAIDDINYNGHEPYFTISRLYRKVKDGCAESRFRKGKRVESFSVNDGLGLGETLYFGREQSDLQIRFYEKDLERISAGKELEDGVTCWNRTELQCRRVRAESMAVHILNADEIGQVASGVLKNYLNFLVKNENDESKERWKTCVWWSDFLGDVEPLKLTMIAPDKTIERSISWINKQVTPTLGMLFLASGADMDMIVDLLNDGMDRITDEQLSLAENYLEKLKVERKHKEYLKNIELQKHMFRTTNTNKKPTDHNDQ